ncbi:hypothetical protein Hanom_Chr17g01577231 [Helianthus anomalus]
MLMRMFCFHFMLASNLLKVTAVVGLWGWTAVSLSVSSPYMFIRCSSKETGYMDGGYAVGVRLLELLCHREKVVFCGWCIVEF